MDTISPLSSVLPVGSSTSSHGRGRNSGQHPFAEGQVVKATVVQANGNQRFILDINNHQLSALSTANLMPGQKLQLQVMQLEPQIELKIVSDSLSRFIGRTIHLLGNSINLTEIFAILQGREPTPLASLTPSSRLTLENYYTWQQSFLADRDAGIILKRLIENLGLGFERLLFDNLRNDATNTLKAALFDVIHHFANADELAEATEKVLTTIELFQIAQSTINDTTRTIYPLPLPFIEKGYLIVDNQQNTSTGEEVSQDLVHFVLHLTMSELGNVYVDFFRNPYGLFLRFQSETQETADFLASQGDFLQSLMASAVKINLSFTMGASDPVASLLRLLNPAGNTVLDTLV